jgi:hypothetical protein
LTCLLLASAPAFAQKAPTSDVESQAAKPAETKKARAAAESAASLAGRREAGGQTATYEQVLANPDDARLNYLFARKQIQDGDLKGASATLERILMVNPDLADIRLLYAVVLFRLNDLSESLRELQALEGAELPEAAKKERAGYLAAVEKRLKKTHLSGRLSAGFEYDTNRNAAPASGSRLVADVPFTVTGTGVRRDDTSALFMGNVEVRRDLPHGHEAFASFDYYRSEQNLIPLLNLQAYSAALGGVLRPAPGWDVTPTVSFDHVLLHQSTFLRNRGLGLRVEKALNRRTSLFVEARDVYNDFVNTLDLPNASDRTGIQADLVVGASRILTPTNKLTASYTHGMKHAAQAYWAYSREGFELSDLWLTGAGTFVLTTGGVRYDHYSRPDPSVSAANRRDTTWRLALTGGAPLGFIHPAVKDVLATLNYEYFQATSNLVNWAYTNNKISALLTWRWEVGL